MNAENKHCHYFLHKACISKVITMKREIIRLGLYSPLLHSNRGNFPAKCLRIIIVLFAN